MTSISRTTRSCQVSGSQEGFAHIGFAFAGPNDLILAPDPGYPIFTFGPLMTGATIGALSAARGK